MKVTRHYGTLILLSTFFLVFQFALFLPRLSPWLAAKGPATVFPAPFWGGLLLTVGAQIGAWFIVTLLLGRIVELALERIPVFDEDSLPFAIGVWITAIITLLAAHQIYFPRSLFSDFSSTLINPALALILMNVGLVLLVLLVLLALTQRRAIKDVLLITSIFAGVFIAQHLPKASQTTQANIIVIGIDSLRPDHLSDTPNIAQFVEHSTLFTNTITPLGRTFPAWVSILTGLPPKETGIRYDLSPLESLDKSITVSQILKNHGYDTWFITDETRFSNIDESFGFDHLIQPPIGANDFVFGHYNDFPLSNFLANTRLGHWLFPFNYANRASFLTYYPDTFNQAIRDGLSRQISRPVFIGIHFCLPHWPYVWAATPRDENPSDSLEMMHQLYKRSLAKADEQFRDFLQILSDRKLLEKSFIVVMSDHGESLGMPGDRMTEPENFLPKNRYQTSEFAKRVAEERLAKPDATLGHGTDVLSPSQNQVLLAMQLPTHSSTAKLNFLTSLIDIKPTILDFAGITPNNGVSLLPYLNDPKHAAPAPRSVTTETDFAPRSIINTKPTEQELIEFGKQHYQTDPKTGRITINAKTIDLINQEKQFATITDHTIEACYPNGKSQIHITYNLDTQTWQERITENGPCR